MFADWRVRPGGGSVLPDPGTLTTSPAMRSGINNGAITGNYVGVQSHAFVRSPDGTITSFDAPTFCQPAVQANPVSINDEGVIVGQCGSNRFPGQPSWVRFP